MVFACERNLGPSSLHDGGGDGREGQLSDYINVCLMVNR